MRKYSITPKTFIYFIQMQHPSFLCVFNSADLQNNALELTVQIQKDEIVERCRRGDRRSYGELYDKYAKAMYNTSLRIVNHTGDAEDVLQESFCDAFTSIDSFGYKSTFGAWLKRIVINKSINALRKRKMDIIDIDKTIVPSMPDDNEYDESEIKFKIDEVRKAISILPNGYRTVLTLQLLEGYDQEEIAEILQVTHSTVRTQYMRAKQKLLILIKQGGLS
jgi:RNA polymerase sigma factor (sigma-70 family)